LPVTGVGVGAPGGGDDGLPLGCGEPLGCGDPLGEPLGFGDPLGDALGDGGGDVEVAGHVCDRLNQSLAGATPVVVVTSPEPLWRIAPAVVTIAACFPPCRNVGPDTIVPLLNVIVSVLNAVVLAGRTKNQPS
jgi:hypothetical protein